jgi:hypothetical protein
MPALSVPLSTLPLVSAIRLSSASTGPLRRVRGGVSFHHCMVRWRREDRTGSAVSSTSTHWLGDVTDQVFGSPTGVPRRDLAIDARLRVEVPS